MPFPLSEEPGMSQDGPENQSHGNAHPASRQNRKTNHVGIALAAISAVVTCAWVLPSVFDYWGHWWMKAIVCAFGITTAYLLYAILRQWARWSHELAFFAASILAIFYFTVLTVAWVGGDMARIFSERRVRLGLAVFLTIGASRRRKSRACPCPAGCGIGCDGHLGKSYRT